ncbi:MAG: hypothetical protein ACI81L_003107 [Verrucomicrobiales bacterium]|jgi:hypothetical protein
MMHGMHRFGDTYYEAFAEAVDARRRFRPAPDPADALSMIEAAGHEVVSTAARSALSERAPFAVSQLTLLAWRGIDDAQERFAQAVTAQDAYGATGAIEAAAAHLALVEAVSLHVAAAS